MPNADMSAEDCGRLNWSKIPYSYFSDYAHHPRSTDATIVFIGPSRLGKVGLGIFIQPPVFGAKRPARYAFTTDGGKNWSVKVHPIPSNLGSIPNWFLQAPSDLNVRYKFDQNRGIYLRSEDRGRSWMAPQYLIDGKTGELFAQEIGGAKGYQIQVTLESIHPKEPKTLLAGVTVTRKPPTLDWRNTKYVYRSIDGGEHWTTFNRDLNAFPNSVGSAAPIGINPYSPNIYFGMGATGLLKSSDSGKSWHLVGPSEDLLERPVYLSETQGGPKMLGAPVRIDIYQFAFDPNRIETTYIVSNKGLFKSVDGGATWRLLDLGFDEIDSINSVGVSPLNGQELYVGSRYGVFRSEDGGCSFERVYPAGKNEKMAVAESSR